MQRAQPPQKPGEEVKLLYASQIGTAPPTFAIVSNRPDDVPESYQRYLVHGFREAWGSSGSPLRIKFTSRGVQAAVTPAAAAAGARVVSAGRHPHELPGRAGSSAGSTCGSTAAATSAPPTSTACSAGSTRSRSGSSTSSRARCRCCSSPRGVGDPGCSPWRSALTAVLGHVFSVFVGFKGGKGVATAAGVMLGLTPWAVARARRHLGDRRVGHGLRVARQHRGARRCCRSLVWFLYPGSRNLVRRSTRWWPRGSSGCTAPTSSGCSRAPRTASASAGGGAAGMTRIAVLGAGSWGTTLADLLARKGNDVRLWAYEPEVVEAINRSHVNPLFLPESPLAPSLRASGDAAGDRGATPSWCCSAAPSHAVRAVIAARGERDASRRDRGERHQGDRDRRRSR